MQKVSTQIPIHYKIQRTMHRISCALRAGGPWWGSGWFSWGRTGLLSGPCFGALLCSRRLGRGEFPTLWSVRLGRWWEVYNSKFHRLSGILGKHQCGSKNAVSARFSEVVLVSRKKGTKQITCHFDINQKLVHRQEGPGPHGPDLQGFHELHCGTGRREVCRWDIDAGNSALLVPMPPDVSLVYGYWVWNTVAR